MAGKPFETYRVYLEHFRESAAHQNDAESEEILDALGNTDVIAPSQDQQDHNSPSQLVGSDIFVCHEPCCHRYGFNFRCKSEYSRHADAPSHIAAADIGKTLLENMQPGSALVAEREAIRNRRCNAPGCFSFGETFSTAKSFFNHIDKLEHRKAWMVTSSIVLDEQGEDLALPGMSIDAHGIGTCVNERCPKVSATFNTPQKMKQHARSFGHATTEEDMDSMDESSPGEVWVSCNLDGMEVTRDKSLWRCVKNGCRRFGDTMVRRDAARRHTFSMTHYYADDGMPMSPETPIAHTMAVDGMASTDESPEEVWVSCDLDDIKVVKGKGLWICVKKGCGGFGKTIFHWGHARKHSYSTTHITAEQDVTMPPEEEVWLSCDLEDMEAAKGTTLWRCTKRGCKGFGHVYNQRCNARRHSSSAVHATADQDATMSPETPTTPFAHAMACTDESPEEVWVSSEFEGMEIVEDKALWRCIKRGCRGFGHIYNQSGNVKKHFYSISHTKADQNETMSPETPTTPSATTQSVPETTLMTPMDLDTPVPATPLSPSAGRGSSAAMTLATPTKTPTSFRTPPSRTMIKLRRTSNTSSQVKRRQDELERRNWELEDRVKRLEEQLARVLGNRATQETTGGCVHEQGNASEEGNKDVDHLYKFNSTSNPFPPIRNGDTI
ncbi:hypothetical protein CEP52_004562 [Fusarium oligoseptatum]|uniref:Uncharacterized protein n=1 Tax=Fusarium oligoseptatum TaxID=2604345 RepID=A0A428U363_9HYPO|nr:hypothetical protein CEP52_004562 [Fusarium oligoseptatum]